MNRNEAILWTEKLASGYYNQEELDLFLDYLKTAEQPDIDAVLSAYHKYLGDQPSHELQVRAGFMDQLKKLQPGPATAPSSNTFIIPRWLKLSAAAVLLICLSAGLYWFISQPEQNKLPVAVSAKDSTYTSPDHNKAMLTLADGTVIPLDAVQQSDIPDQQGTKIIKIDSALLSYQNNTGNSVSNQPLVFNTVTVPTGGQYQLILADGSHVWLNSASSLKFPTAFTSNERRVELQGEGYFEIAKNAAKPFIVATGNSQVQVLGTHFNVMAYTDEEAIKTTLLEGSVKLTNDNHQTLIRPGQQAVLLPGNNAKFAVNTANIDEVIAWKEGRFRFDEMNIKPIMRQIARWYDVEISYEGDLSGITLSGSVPRKENVNQLLRALEMSNRVKFEMTGNRIVVKSFNNQN